MLGENGIICHAEKTRKHQANAKASDEEYSEEENYYVEKCNICRNYYLISLGCEGCNKEDCSCCSMRGTPDCSSDC